MPPIPGASEEMAAEVELPQVAVESLVEAESIGRAVADDAAFSVAETEVRLSLIFRFLEKNVRGHVDAFCKVNTSPISSGTDGQ
jgi:hypothetical protein